MNRENTTSAAKTRGSFVRSTVMRAADRLRRRARSWLHASHGKLKELAIHPVAEPTPESVKIA